MCISFNNYTLLILGVISGLAFAPCFFLPVLFSISIIVYIVQKQHTYKSVIYKSCIFGLGHFLTNLYWIGIAVSIYIEDFWWAIPLGIFGLPLILSIFIILVSLFSWFFRDTKYYRFIFCIFWVFFEWLRSWIFTGLPWNLLGYVFSFSNALMQSVSIISIYGLSFIVIYISTSLYYYLIKDYRNLKISVITSSILLFVIYLYGYLNLINNPTEFTDIKVRMVQPSIKQEAKWDSDKVLDNLNKHINLSVNKDYIPDLIIWSEAALVTHYDHQIIKGMLSKVFYDENIILITGGITYNNDKLYTSLYALDSNLNMLFEYNKSHLVPFGEYVPFKDVLNVIGIKKITSGFIDYSQGNRDIVKIDKLKISIQPLICYESIFPNEAKISNKKVDAIINVTNDSWYGNSFEPYQHLYISKVRAIENGLPMIRVSNNGISMITDPLGRIINELGLNEIGVIDSFMPKKLDYSTLYSIYGDVLILLIVLLVLIIQLIVNTLI